jgi:hypothetical protein
LYTEPRASSPEKRVASIGIRAELKNGELLKEQEKAQRGPRKKNEKKRGRTGRPQDLKFWPIQKL